MMVTPNNRKSFERNMDLLIEEVITGRFRTNFRSHLVSMMNVKPLPNRRQDFLTIDESVRLLANMEANKKLMGLE